MQTSCKTIILMFVVLLIATSFNCVFDVTINLNFLYTFTILINMTITQIPKVKINVKKINHMMITMINMFDHNVFLFFDSNVDVFFSRKKFLFTILNNNNFTQYAYFIDWAGWIEVDSNLNLNASKIEVSYMESFNMNVNYVDDYSVSIICFFDDILITDCNIDFFKQSEIWCNDEIEKSICLNLFWNIVNEFVLFFFAICESAVYTYSNDNDVNVVNIKNNVIFCCINTSCKTFLKKIKYASYQKRVRFKKWKIENVFIWKNRHF